MLPFQVVKKRAEDERRVKRKLTENTCIRPTATAKRTSGKRDYQKKSTDEADEVPPARTLQITPTKSPSLSKFSTVELHSPLKGQST